MDEDELDSIRDALGLADEVIAHGYTRYFADPWHCRRCGMGCSRKVRATWFRSGGWFCPSCTANSFEGKQQKG